MKAGFRQSMAWLHTWIGLFFGWILFAIFLTGTLSYFRQEISLWMQPELPRAVAAAPAEAAEQAFLRLSAIAPGAARWMVDLPNDRDPLTHLYAWQKSPPGFQREALDPRTGQPAKVRATYGGDFLYYFHFDLQMPSVWGRMLVGIATMAMLAAIVSGIVVHRRFFADFFTFRAWGSAQRAWLDGHNVLGVLALPFHLVISYTGLVIFMFLYLPWGIDRFYDGDMVHFTEAAFEEPAAAPPGAPAPLVAISPLIRSAERASDGQIAGRVEVLNPDRTNSVVIVTASDSHHLAHARNRVVFEGATGRILDRDDDLGGAAATFLALYGLHIARFADPVLRWLLFASGLAGSGMIASGLVLWTVKRRARLAAGGAAPRGLRLAEALNVAVILGLIGAVAGFFLANRLLPLDWPDRADAEAKIFFAVWASALLHALLRPSASARRAWIEQSVAAGALCLAVPLINAATTERSLATTLAAGDWPLAGFDLTTAVAGGMLLLLAARLARR